MSEYTAKNYIEQGGDRMVIGGELVFEEEARISGLPSSNSISGVVVLDMQDFDLLDALNDDVDITEIISPELFKRAASGQSIVLINNLGMSAFGGSFSSQNVETLQGQLIFAVGYVAGSAADIQGMISVEYWLLTVGDEDAEERVMFRSNLNVDMNAALGFSILPSDETDEQVK